MKQPTLTTVLMSLMMMAMLSLSACAKKDDSKVRIVGRAGGGTGTAVGAGGYATCGAQAQSTGKIFDAQSNSARFEADVKSFVSATLDPQYLGSVSGDINAATGIDFLGGLRFNAQGQLEVESASLMIKIFDSYAKQTYNGQVVQPYVIEFVGASSGMIDHQTRQFQVTFKDAYGSVTMQGSFSQNGLASGTVTYENFIAVEGYFPARGTLGSFRIATCGLIK